MEGRKEIWYDKSNDTGKEGFHMLGAVCGDIIGSYYEVHCTKDEAFPLFTEESTFTDDSVLTAAVCEAILYHPNPVQGFNAKRERAREYALRYKQYSRRYPGAGFGQDFYKWASNRELTRQHSYANGAAMRVAPIGWAYESLEEVVSQAELSCLYTHRHKEAITGAKAVASAVFLARSGESKETIRKYLQKKFRYDLSTPLSRRKERFVFDSRASYSVPPAIQAFLESSDYEGAVRGAVAMGGDSDTMACIAGGIAEAYYKEIPDFILQNCWTRLDSGLRATLRRFYKSYSIPLL